MPIYEFQCHHCRRRTTALVLSRARVSEVRCKHCGSAELTKLFSRFATPKSEEARLESYADSSALGNVDENDPRSVARWMKRMGQETGEDMGDEIDAAMEEDLKGGGEPGETPDGDDA